MKKKYIQRDKIYKVERYTEKKYMGKKIDREKIYIKKEHI